MAAVPSSHELSYFCQAAMQNVLGGLALVPAFLSQRGLLAALLQISLHSSWNSCGWW